MVLRKRFSSLIERRGKANMKCDNCGHDIEKIADNWIHSKYIRCEYKRELTGVCNRRGCYCDKPCKQ